MSPRTIIEDIHADVPLLHDTTSLGESVRVLLESGLPALPVIDGVERYRGIFGEREFIGALFPGYVKTLGYAGFVPRPIEDVLKRRLECTSETVRQHMNTEHVDVPSDASDIQIAETFLSHRVLIVPVTDEGRVVGVLTRTAFFRAVAERFVQLGS